MTVAPLGALAGLIALAGIGVLVTQPSTAASPAVLEVVEPSVEVQAEPRYGFADAGSGDSVTEGSVIRTDRTGVAAVAYDDGSLTRIGPATTYRLVTLRTEEGRREIIGKLDRGRTFHRVSKVTGSASRFEVHTSNAVAAVRGTEFAVQCLVLDICEYAVTEGIVNVRSTDGREVDVTAGTRVTVDGDGHLGELKLLSENDPWIASNTAGTEPTGSTEPESADAETSTVAEPEPAQAGYRSWGGFSPPTSSSDPEVAAGEPAEEDESAAPNDRGTPSESQQSPTPTTASAESTPTTTSDTTSTTAPTTTTTEQATTTTTGPSETTTTTRPDEGERPTTTSTCCDRTTTTTTRDGDATTTTTSGSGGGSGGGTTTTTSAGGGSTTTTTSDGTTTTTTSEPTTTTTSGPCPEGEEPVEGRGCRPKCPHDRPRDPNGNCQRERSSTGQSEESGSASRASAGSTGSKDAGPFLWIFSFFFGGTVLVRRAPDHWDS